MGQLTAVFEHTESTLDAVTVFVLMASGLLFLRGLLPILRARRQQKLLERIVEAAARRDSGMHETAMYRADQETLRRETLANIAMLERRIH